MIPNNITKEAILKAIHQIDCEGIPKERNSRTYNIYYNGKLYPPKYVISVANRFCNGYELPPDSFGGGAETNVFLLEKGFTVTSCLTNNSKPDILTVVTVTLESGKTGLPKNPARFHLMETILPLYLSADIILFPAGFFYLRKQSARRIFSIADQVSQKLKQLSSSATVCFGIDCNQSIDQLAVAVNQNGISSMGRKFYPTDTEKGVIRAAENHNTTEMGYSRIFEVHKKRIYLAVCYDCFGIRHCDIPNPGVDAVLVLAHRFFNRGEGTSGDVDFARKGFAGTSQQWACPVFGTAVFFNRAVPQNWPTGVLWTDKQKSIRNFKYQDNELNWKNQKEITGEELALCYEYNI